MPINGNGLPQPRLRRDYRLKLIEATQGNRSILGCIVLAAIGREPSNPPFFRGKATIAADGQIYCDFVERGECQGVSVYHAGARVGDDEDFARNILSLALHCDLNDEERIEFLARVNAWIGTDHRSKGRIAKVLVT